MAVHFNKYCIFLLVLSGMAASCKQEPVEYSNNECKKQPAFIKSLGFNPARTAFSTSERRMQGLVMFELNNAGDTSHGGRRVYQHSSWKSGGWLGPIQVDAEGNCFAGPIPVINVLDNPAEKQNIVYRVDAQTGEMKIFTSLPVADSISPENAYGILGFAYLCESNTLYVSTVQGSTREKEKGILYAVDAATGEVKDKLVNKDVLGMGISYMSGQRCLYFGSARSSDVYSVVLSEKGTFNGNPAAAFSLAGLGPRGDDKVRRIRFDKATGQMQVSGVEFNFNLTAPTEKQENIYTFNWNEDTKKWEYAL